MHFKIAMCVTIVYILALRIYFTFYVYNFCLNYEMLQFSSMVQEFPRMLVCAPLVIFKLQGISLRLLHSGPS